MKLAEFWRKECGILGGQNILWLLLRIFRGSRDPPNPQDVRLCAHVLTRWLQAQTEQAKVALHRSQQVSSSNSLPGLLHSASDRQRLEGFLRRGRRYGLYPADQATIVQLIEEADETLFNNIRHNPLHILQPLLPKQIDYCYSLRPRSHNFELTHNHDNRNFIDRMLFCNPCSLA